MSFDIVIITALPDERDAVLALGDGSSTRWTEARDASQLRYHHRTFERPQGGALKIAVAWAGDMGETSAAVRAQDLIKELAPKCLAMCGICAGRRGEVFLGDVIVADRVFKFDAGKFVASRAADAHADGDFLHEVKTYNLSQKWKMDAEELGRNPEWCADFVAGRPMSLEWQIRWLLRALLDSRDHGAPSPSNHPDRGASCPDWSKTIELALKQKLTKIIKGSLALTARGIRDAQKERVSRPGDVRPDPDFKVHVGVIATGASVRQDPALFARLAKVQRKTLGVEMEAAAIGLVADRSDILSIIVKSVSDYGDHDKDDSFRAFACRSSAEFLLAFFTRYFPDQSGSATEWSALAASTEQWRDLTRDLIGRDVHVPRAELRQQLAEVIATHRIVVLLGDSGAGKSALVKEFLASEALAGPAYSIYVDEIPRFELPHLGTSDGAVPLHDLLPKQPAKWALLVLDSMERLLVAPASTLRLVALSLQSMRLGEDGSRWRLILTCQAASWEHVKQALISHNVTLSGSTVVEVPLLTITEIHGAAKTLDFLSPVLLREDLIPVMGRPKVLDLIATAAIAVGPPDTTHWVGESNVIQWWLETYVCARGKGRDERHVHLLQVLARAQADSRKFVIPLDDLPDTAAIGLLPDLAALGIISQKNGTIRISHDLYADYARQGWLLSQILVGRSNNVRECVVNPLWHRSIRLLGQHSLESSGETYQDDSRIGWRPLLEQMRSARPDDDGDDEGPTGTGADLLLEAITFSAQSELILDRLAYDLRANRGSLLRSFLFRFLNASTGSVMLVATKDQKPIPDVVIWAPVLRWIVRHEADVLSLAPDQFISIAWIWLQVSNSRLAHDIGGLVVTLAERRGRGSKKLSQLYQLALFCAPEYTDRVVALALELSGRTRSTVAVEKEWSSAARRDQEDVPEHLRYLLAPSIINPPRLERPEPWPDGPIAGSDPIFRNVGLGVGAVLVVRLGCRLAKEIFLALLIEIPKARDTYNYDFSRDSFGLVPYTSWNQAPPFYDYPPVRELLDHDVAIAIDFVVQVVNFTTERWAEGWALNRRIRPQFISDEEDNPGLTYEGGAPCIQVRVDGERRTFLGNRRVFEWSNGTAITPRTASAMLMCLERWLYEQEESGRLNQEILARILRESKSVAVLGVLFNLALKVPLLLLGPLKELIASPEIYLWARVRTREHSSDRGAAMIAWRDLCGRKVERHDAALAWHGMPHRGESFLSAVRTLCCTNKSDIWPTIERARADWIAALGCLEDGDTRQFISEELLDGFDPDRWGEVLGVDGKKRWIYAPPVVEPSPADQALVVRLSKHQRECSAAMSARYILEGKITPTEEMLIELLTVAKNLTPMDDREEFMTGGEWGMRCAAAAVAFLRFRPWLDAHGDWKERCRDWLLSACLDQGRKSMLASQFVMFSWASSCAYALPALWIEQPNDPKLREAMAILVAATYDNTTANSPLGRSSNDPRVRLFMDVAAARERLGDDFSHLLNLAVWFARLLHIGRAGPPSPAPDVDRAYRRLVKDFVKQRSALLPTDWVHLAHVWPPWLHPPKAWPKWILERGADNGFDMGALVSSMSWLPGEVDKSGSPGRSGLIDIVWNLSMSVIGMLGEVIHEPANFSLQSGKGLDATPLANPTAAAQVGSRGNRLRVKTRRIFPSPRPRELIELRLDHSSRTPNMVDYLVAEWCAGFIVREPDKAVRSRLWEPWLRLPLSRHDWPALLIRKMYLEGFREAAVSSHFVDSMRDMFDFSFAPGGWLDGESASSGNGDVARAFLGPDYVAFSDAWSTARARVAVALREYWRRWVGVAITWFGCAADFLRLLCSPAMTSLRADGFCWLADSNVDKWYRKDDVRDPLFTLLLRSWDEHIAGKTPLEPRARTPFEYFLEKLVALQDPRAVELTRQVAARGW